MNHRRPTVAQLLAARPSVVGIAIIVVALVGLYLSYNATRGAPLVPRYTVNADVPDAAQLTRGVSEVRIGGARVGLVKDIDAMPEGDRRAPYSRLVLSLDRSLAPLPTDTTVQVRPRSILGAKYLALVPGSDDATVADGGTLSAARARPAFAFDKAFRIFDAQTQAGIRMTTRGLGDGIAGRGQDINTTVASSRRLLGPLPRVMRNLSAPTTDLRGLLRGGAQATRALAPVAPELGALIDHSATTLRAIGASAPALDRTLALLPPTESTGTTTLRRARPVLQGTAALSRELARATPLARPTARQLSGALRTATPVFADIDRGGRVNAELNRTLNALRRVADDRARRPALVGLVETVKPLRPLLNVLTPAQLQCNVAGLFARNFSDLAAGGDNTGHWANYLVQFDTDFNGTDNEGGPSNLMLQSAGPSRRLHHNAYPATDGRECEAGNEPYRPGQQIGDVPGLQLNTTASTDEGRR